MNIEHIENSVVVGTSSECKSNSSIAIGASATGILSEEQRKELAPLFEELGRQRIKRDSFEQSPWYKKLFHHCEHDWTPWMSFIGNLQKRRCMICWKSEEKE